MSKLGRTAIISNTNCILHMRFNGTIYYHLIEKLLRKCYKYYNHANKATYGQTMNIKDVYYPTCKNIKNEGKDRKRSLNF